MSSSTKLAGAAAAAVVVVAIGLAAMIPNRPGNGGTPTPSPTSAATPAATPAITPASDPTAAPGESMPIVSQTFRSVIHGITTDYPEGWETRAATRQWATDTLPRWASPEMDAIFDPALLDHLFLGLASQTLGDENAAAWIDRRVTAEGCPSSAPVVVDGADGQLAQCGQALMAFVSERGRGYFLVLYRSPDEPYLEQLYGVDFFNEILASVKLRPGAAVDASPAPG